MFTDIMSENDLDHHYEQNQVQDADGDDEASERGSLSRIDSKMPLRARDFKAS